MYLLKVTASEHFDSPNSFSFSRLNSYMTQEIDVSHHNRAGQNMPVINWHFAKQLQERRKSDMALKSCKLSALDVSEHPEAPKRIYSLRKPPSDNIVFLTANLERGLSDIILFQPILRAFSEKLKAEGLPGKIHISGSNEFRHLFYKQDYLDEFLPEAPTLETLSKYDYFMEAGIKLERLKTIACVSDWSEIDLRAKINLPPGVTERWIERFKGNKPRVFLHWHAFDSKRILPIEWFKTIVEQFPNADYYCSIYGEKNDGEIYPGGPVNLWPHEENILDLFGALSCMDAVVTTNTGIAHAAGAIDRPTITIFTGVLYGWGDFWPNHHKELYPSLQPIGLSENLSLPPEDIVNRVVAELKRLTAG